jgi:hypothetical protein
VASDLSREVSALAPKRLIVLTGGEFNFFSGMSAITISVAIGYWVEGGDFTPVLMGGLSVFAAFCYVVLGGKLSGVAGVKWRMRRDAEVWAPFYEDLPTTSRSRFGGF